MPFRTYLRDAVLHFGGEHAHPLSCQLGLEQQPAHPAHRRGVLGRHSLEDEQGRLGIAAGHKAVVLEAEAGLGHQKVSGQLGHHVLIGNQGGAIVLQHGRFHQQFEEERKVGLEVDRDFVGVEHREQVHKVGIHLR